MRLDVLLVERGLAETRTRAQALIRAGLVRVRDQIADKPGNLYDGGTPLEVREKEHSYVSRGGVKLAHGLDAFGLSPLGLICLDAGASTGGFTDCLLQRGALEVHAVDVGKGQLDWGLRNDPRVRVHEEVNARYLPPDFLPQPAQAMVMDVSFISATLVLEAVLPLLRGWGIVLVKPQFEAGREHVGKGGVVREEAARKASVLKVERYLVAAGAGILGCVESPLLGPAGNVEYLLAFEFET